MSPATLVQSLYANRWVRRVVWLVVSVLLLWALAWAIVPPILKSQLVKAASAQLGRTLTVGDIDFKPWTLELTVRDLAIATQDGSAAQLAIKRLYVDAELESLLRLAPVVQALELDEPVVRLRHRGDGAYDIDDILARFAAAPKKPDAKPLEFALFNLLVNKGSMDFDDQAAGRVHTVRDVRLSLPFISNLASRRAIKVTPELAFRLNGSAFQSTASSVPFDPSRDTDARLRIEAMDLAPYLAYVPKGIPVRLRKAVLDADLQLQFAQLPKPQLIVRGQARLAGVEMTDGTGQPLLAFDKLAVVLDQLRPLEQVVDIGSLELQAPRLHVLRDGAGKINLAALQAAATTPAAAAGSSAAAQPEGGAWHATLARIQVRAGTMDWRDDGVAPAAQLQLHDLTLDAKDLVWPMAHPVTFAGALAVATTGADKAASAASAQAPRSQQAAKLVFDGSATDQQASVQLKISDAPLTLAAPYLAQLLEPGVRGVLDADVALQWRQPSLQLAVSSLTLDQLALVGVAGSAELPRIKQVSVASAKVDLAQRSWAVKQVTLTQPELAVTRGANKRWMFESWLKTATPAAAGSAPAAAAGGGSTQPWHGRLDQLLVRDAAVRFQDLAQAKPVQLTTSALNLDLRGIAQDGRQPIATQLSAKVATGKGQAGQVDYRGTLQVEPLRAKGRVQMTQLPLHALEPYFGSGLNIEILRADAGFKGDVDVAMTAQGPLLSVRGDGVLEDFRANSIASQGGESGLAQELLNWKALGLRGVDLAMAPGKPLRLAVRETTLSDFYARVIVHETGRINLQDLVRSDAPAAPADGVSTAKAAASSAAAKPTVAVVAPPVAPIAGPDPMAPVIQIGPISLVQGKVLFSDRFVKPNYSADLTELTGKLSAFSSVPVDGQPLMADLELRGRAEGTASLEILGKINPLAKPLALDIKGKVRDLELPPLSPYAIKYAGYGIQRGKLSVDVAYQILPDGQLTASNQVVLNQLAFGDKVEGAPNSLPVKLAVALLADSHGVIDINLPISGSLNDPQFRLGPVIFKVIVNLIGKALTAPFTLLASAFGGGGDELSQVAFAAGTAVLQADAQAGLDKVAKALADRPALKMTVVGTANLQVERDAFKRSRLQELLRAERRREQVSAGQTPVASSVQTDADLAPEEAARLLRQVFARSDIPKPRDLSGKLKELTPAEMEALVLANLPADEDSMRALALQRGVAVKDYLAARQLPLERLFLGAAKLVDGDAKWTPRAELSLGTN